ncbi:MAG TPA: serine hydrolase [Planctomycetaceae bacterium]|nr:serine hydrolase [Planctomycetaceae bacterium]
MHRVSPVFLLAALVVGICHADDLPRSTPEAQGIAAADLVALVDALDAHGDAASADGVHSVMLVRHGHVVAEGWWAPYTAAHRHQLYSLSKSFTATAVGIAAAEGRLSADDTVLGFFPDEAPAEPSANLRAMRVTDLLRMATGQQTEPPRKEGTGWIRQFLAHPVPFKPGTHFLYNTAATYMQSAVVQKATGLTLLDYLGPRLFAPLAIEGATWEESPEGISTGGFGLSIRTGDIASFGQLLLDRGQWRGRQLVPAEWIDAATSRQVANGSNPDSDWDQGYGYQFWRCRHGAFRGDGAFGQFCVVLPQEDAVVAITAGTRDMQGILTILWRHLLPALRAAPLPPDDAGNARLRERLAALAVPRPGAGAPPAALVGKTFRFPDNAAGIESLRLEPTRGEGDAAAHLVLASAGGEQRIPLGTDRFVASSVAWGGKPPEPAAVALGREGEECVVRICFVETPYVTTLRLRPDGTGVRLSGGTNVGFSPTKFPDLVGTSTTE